MLEVLPYLVMVKVDKLGGTSAGGWYNRLDVLVEWLLSETLEDYHQDTR